MSKYTDDMRDQLGKLIKDAKTMDHHLAIINASLTIGVIEAVQEISGLIKELKNNEADH